MSTLAAVVKEIRYSLRRLRRSPAFTATALITLAFGIGGTTAIFSLTRAVLLQPLPVTHPEQLYRIGDNPFGGVTGGLEDNFGTFSYDLYKYFRDQTPEFASLAASQADIRRVSVRRAGSPSVEPFFGEYVSGNYFDTLGLTAAAGRSLRPSDEQADALPVAVLSYQVWQEKFGLDSSTVGSTIAVNGHAVVIVGIAPRGFFGTTLRPDPPDVWMPLVAERLMDGANAVLDQRTLHWLFVLGRIQDGVDPTALDARLKVELRQWLTDIAPGLAPEDRLRLPRQTVHLVPARSGIASARAIRTLYGTGLRLLMAISAAVLLVVAANLANLGLVRSLENRRESAVRIALGAARSRLVADALVESLLLALAGGGFGLGLAALAVPIIMRLAFTSARFVPTGTPLNWGVLLFALTVTVVTGATVGVVPAWIAARVEPAGTLRGTGRATSSVGRRTQRGLVILQAALALALLVASGLLARSLGNLEGQDLGFQANARMAVRIDPNLAGYEPSQLDALMRALREHLLNVPAVRDVAFASYTPLSGSMWSTGIAIPGRDITFSSPSDWVAWSRVGPRYFQAIGTAILRGRAIGEQDTRLSQHVAVVNQTFVARYFKDEDVVGKRFGKAGPASANDYEIVGVAADTKYFSPGEAVRPMFFLPLTQRLQYADPDDEGFEQRSMYPNDVVLVLAPSLVSPEPLIRQAFSAVDPNLAVIRVLSFTAQVDRTLGQQTLVARLASVYGVFALVLASIGLYGVTAYAVERRTREIGIRMALGAGPGKVLRAILLEASALVGSALVLGVPLALGIGHLLESLLYGVGRQDLGVFLVAVAVLAVFSLVAAILPARRAAALGPLGALRAD